jgi:pilus assembly protein CpaF
MRAVPLEALRPLFDDERVTEVLVNGPGPVWIERDGVLVRTDIVVDRAGLERLIERALGPVGRRVDHASPCVDARLADGSRVNVVVPPIAVDGPCVCIRRFRRGLTDLASLARPAEVELLTWAVRSRANILVVGAAGAGKTTLLNALASVIGPTERVITVEDAAELALAAAHVVRLEARPANSEGLGAVTVRDLVRNALRMRPDRIVVGEIRGDEVVEMIHAMETGHDGSFSTCHANNPADALRRIETMLLAAEAAVPIDAVRRHLAACIDLVVHVERSASGHREIREIAEVHMLAPGAHDLSLRTLVVRGTPQYGPSRRPRAAHAAPFAWSAA